MLNVESKIELICLITSISDSLDSASLNNANFDELETNINEIRELVGRIYIFNDDAELKELIAELGNKFRERKSSVVRVDTQERTGVLGSVYNYVSSFFPWGKPNDKPQVPSQSTVTNPTPDSARAKTRGQPRRDEATAAGSASGASDTTIIWPGKLETVKRLVDACKHGRKVSFKEYMDAINRFRNENIEDFKIFLARELETDNVDDIVSQFLPNLETDRFGNEFNESFDPTLLIKYVINELKLDAEVIPIQSKSLVHGADDLIAVIQQEPSHFVTWLCEKDLFLIPDRVDIQGTGGLEENVGVKERLTKKEFFARSPSGIAIYSRRKNKMTEPGSLLPNGNSCGFESLIYALTKMDV